jgi:hypothetical protein
LGFIAPSRVQIPPPPPSEEGPDTLFVWSFFA